MKRLHALALAGLIAFGALAHDLITAEAAQSWLRELDRWNEVRHSAAEALSRAEAAYRSGIRLEQIRILLNQDLMAHGEVAGLASKALLLQLRRRGQAPAVSSRSGQFAFGEQPFRDALRLAPDAPFAGDAALRLLVGQFYERFGADPLGGDGSDAATAELIVFVESLQSRYPEQSEQEEFAFISAILYTRAGRGCAMNAAADYADKARRAIRRFELRFAGSLRAAVMPVLSDALAGC